ncbi:MAG: hypothetical protein F7C07_08675 [Desulfurococcales archaeon]|nr:hypothetical protein [Desulfurococcales archaeon]
MKGLGRTETEILKTLIEYGPVTLAELARLVRKSRSWTWKKVKKLELLGLVSLERKGGIVIARHTPETYKGLLRLGILRASEYPYIMGFAKLLRNRYANVEILVYDEAFKLALDLVSGRVHLAMAPAVSLLIAHRFSAGQVLIVGGGSKGGAGFAYSGSGTDSHATTMASTMEFCAELHNLKGKRVYKKSGEEILDSVINNEVEVGVLWEPYLELARRKGLETEPCDTPFCCLLGINKSLEEESGFLARSLSHAISEARTGRVDLQAYSNLVGLPYELVKSTVGTYEFLEEAPVDEIDDLKEVLRRTILPDSIGEHAIRRL